ncbi:MAG: DUF4917 family protein [Gemmatimonadetes bacterium]|nr:DUF4917 family protein [Gemmatimonadota bacterium]
MWAPPTGETTAGLLTFSQALDAASATKKQPHVLLGNGFSRAWKDDIFAYSALRDRANFTGLSEHAWHAFDVLDTNDFEAVMRALRNSSGLLGLYAPNSREIAEQMRSDAEGLKEVLVRTIAGSHPDRPNEIASDAYRACKTFLSHFKDIYTLNYDLLLYWTLMQSEIDPQVPCDDGFRKPDEDREATYVTWEPENIHAQNIHYLHGALHLFDAGDHIEKYTWINTGIRLIEQVRDAMNRGLFPIFVAEGDSTTKVERIRHSAYLSKAERSFLGIGGPLFLFGASLGDSDRHVARSIAKSKTTHLFVGIHGSADAPYNQALLQRMAAIAAKRPERKPLAVIPYDATSATVWG